MRAVLFSLVLTWLIGLTPPLWAQDAPRVDLEELNPDTHPGIRLVWDGPREMPGAILGLELPVRSDDPAGDARVWLDRHAHLFGVQDPVRELAFERMSRTPTRQVIRFAQWIGEVPVLGGEIVVVLDQDGNLRSLVNGYIPLDAALDELLEIEPEWDRELAFERAMREGDGLFATPEAMTARDITRLVYVSPVGQSPMLAWEVHPPGVALHLNYKLYYDALTGERLYLVNDIRHAELANVFLFSPGYEGTAEPVVDELLLRDDPDGYLTGPYLKVNNCIDTGETVIRRTREVPICTEMQVAVADESGDFLYEPDFFSPEDTFAEAHMFYHTMRIYQYHRNLGLDTVTTVPLMATVNYRVAADTSSSEERLAPYDNAFFYPAGDYGYFVHEYDSIVFGQGTEVDFSYDADVIYHEFTHAVFQKIASPGYLTYDEYGLRSDPGALNEAMADYFAGTVTGDPEIGEFVGPRVDFSADPARNIRTLENTATCPTSLIGESHQDSVHFSGALWEIRSAFLEARPEEIEVFDGAVYNAMNQFTELVTFDRAAALLAHELEDLGVELEEEMEAAWARHGVLDCQRWIDLSDPESAGGEIYLFGTDYITLTPWVPGFVQYRVTIPESDRIATSIGIGFDFFTYDMGRWGGPVVPGFVISENEPVQFRISGTRLSGNWTQQIEASSVLSTRYQATWEVPEGIEPGEYYFLPVGLSGIESLLWDVQADVEYKDAEPEEELEPVVEPAPEEMEEQPEELLPDAGTADQGAEEVESDMGASSASDDDGCGCSATGFRSAGRSVGVLLLAGFGILFRRRRLNHT
ncbi:MAG: hypothetical protein JW797_11205 [Bradymonadales bacterium]|nr:hypothetical protein [Bradymonadales bacterium]